jgi:hypothetical protein
MAWRAALSLFAAGCSSSSPDPVPSGTTSSGCSDLSLSGSLLPVTCASNPFPSTPGAKAPLGTYALKAIAALPGTCDSFKGVVMRATLVVKSDALWEIGYERSAPGKATEQGTQTFAVTYGQGATLKQTCSTAAGLFPDGTYGVAPGAALQIVEQGVLQFTFGAND